VKLINPLMASFYTAHYEIAASLSDGRRELEATRAELAETRDELALTQTALAKTRTSLEHLGLSVDEAHRRLNGLTDDVAAANALSWDQAALARRLAELEDQALLSPPRE
jgi:septal ring factor EnvC (AmiA/AmiB activator)